MPDYTPTCDRSDYSPARASGSPNQQFWRLSAPNPFVVYSHGRQHSRTDGPVETIRSRDIRFSRKVSDQLLPQVLYASVFVAPSFAGHSQGIARYHLRVFHYIRSGRYAQASSPNRSGLSRTHSSADVTASWSRFTRVSRPRHLGAFVSLRLAGKPRAFCRDFPINAFTMFTLFPSHPCFGYGYDEFMFRRNPCISISSLVASTARSHALCMLYRM